MTRPLVLRVVWNLRWLALFLLGPVVGVALVSAVFGLPGELEVAAAGMFLLSLGLFGVLFKGEARRLSRQP